MGQQVSSDDHDESFKNIISRMLQEADNEESENSSKEDESVKLTSEKTMVKTKTRIKSSVNNGEFKTETNPEKSVVKIESSDMLQKSGLESTSGKNDRELKDSFIKSKMALKVEIGSDVTVKIDGNSDKDVTLKIKMEDDTDGGQKEISAKSSMNSCVKDVSNCKDRADGQKEASQNNVNDKPKSLETMFLKDRIDSLINSCLSAKPTDVDIKKNGSVSNLKPLVDKYPSSFKQENNTSDNNAETMNGGPPLRRNSELPEHSFLTNAEQAQNLPSKSTENQNGSCVKVTENVSKHGNSGGRETTTFQTLIEKVLDNSLIKSKKGDSCQSSNGYRPMIDNRIGRTREQITIKNEIRNELLVKDTSDRLKPESKSDDMSLNKSKVVYLKDHIEKVLEKTFQTSSRKEIDDMRGQEGMTSKFDERYQQNREPDQRTVLRERSQSLVGEGNRNPSRDRSNSFSVQGASNDLRHNKSLDSYDDSLGPPKLLKVTEIYPDANRDQTMYLKPPRIDTYDGNSRGSFKGSLSPGGSYSRSPLDQSPVSPYYNHSPNSWPGHSPREHHVSTNLSPSHTAPSPICQSRFQASPANQYPPNVGMSRYNNVTHSSPQAPSSGRVLQPPYPQTTPLQGYPMEGSLRPGYPVGNQQISPTSQRPSLHYPQQQYPSRTMMQTVHSNENVGHSKHQISTVHHYQQMSPRQQPYPQMLPTSRSQAQYPTPNIQRPPYPHDTRQPYPHDTQQPYPHDTRQPYPHDTRQPYPTETNQNLPLSNSFYQRQSQVNSVFPPPVINNRPNPAGYAENNVLHRSPQNSIIGPVSQRITAPVQRSPHYNTDSRNPCVSSAMALGPVPPQNYLKQHHSQKPPQLFPSSPPIPSVREFNSSRGMTQNQGQGRPEVKYRQQEVVEMPAKIVARCEEQVVITKQSNIAHEQGPILDLSVKREDNVFQSDPEMQPLDLTCKPKRQENLLQQRPATKAYSGFEYLIKGPIEKNVFEVNTGPCVPKQTDNAQYSTQTHSKYPSVELHNTSGSAFKQSDITVSSHIYSQNTQQLPRDSQDGFKQQMSLQIPISNPGVIEGNISPTDMGNKVQGQNAMNSTSQFQQDPKKAPNVSRHEPIQNILGSHSPTDILYLICRLCGQTYGSPYGFRKHFRNQHGFEPRAEHTIVQTISETKTAMQSPPAINNEDFMVAQQPNLLATSNKDESQIMLAQNQAPKQTRLSVSVDFNKGFNSSVKIKEENIGYSSSENLEDFQQKENMDDPNSSGDRKCLECHECGQTFQLNDFGAYKRHCRQHGHSKINNPFDPNFTVDRNSNSGESLKTLKDTSGDMSAVYKEELGNFMCTICKEKFTNNNLYQNHLKNAHLEMTVNVKKRIIGDFQKSHDSKQEEIISSTSITKNPADSMVTTASPDSSSDMVKKPSAAIDSQQRPQTPNIHSQSVKQSGESDSNTETKEEFSHQNSCDSVSQKMEDGGELNTLYLHKKFGTKRKVSATLNNDVIDSKLFKRENKSPRNNHSPSVLSTNSCDSEPSNLPDGKMEVSESDQDSDMSHSSTTVEDSKSVLTNKTEARHQLPFVWDRVTRSQVGRKPQKNN